MSRHKIVKNMDLDDEMDDYNGGEDYADDGVEGWYPPSHSTACIP
jgi:elongation factor 1 alpha-like protein